MKTPQFIIGFLTILTILFTGHIHSASAQNSNTDTEEIIVRFKPISHEKQHYIGQSVGAEINRQLLLERTVTLSVPSLHVDRILERLASSPYVEYAERDVEVYTLETPNDTYYDSQWNIEAISANIAWDQSHGNSAVHVAVVDTGIDRNHEDVASKVSQWVNFTTSSTSDDRYGHGTHVAGIVAADTNNGRGVAGVGYDTSLLSVKVLSDTGSGYSSWVANGIVWAVDNGADVINVSLGTTNPSNTLESALNYAWGNGAVIVCAAGNSGSNQRLYPAFYSNCIATAATGTDNQKTSWSTWGSWVDIAAPGAGIFSTFPNHNHSISSQQSYGSLSGTSMAAPHVSGLAGLLKGVDPTKTNQDIRNLIEENADQIPGTGTFWNNGLVNAHKSIAAITDTAEGPTATPQPTPTAPPTPTHSPTPSPDPTTTPTPTPQTPTPTTILTPTATPQPTPPPISLPWWCRFIPWHRTCQ